MLSKEFAGRLSVYSVSHFCVDFACGYLVTNRCWTSIDGAIAIILYNFFAFAMQMPIGIVADKVNKNALVASIGCLLVLAGLFVGSFTPAIWIAVTIIGIGNGMFHMGGGIDVLNESGKKSGPLGIFVSPGALGLFLGMAYGKGGEVKLLLPCAMMLVCAAAIYGYQRMTRHSMASENVPLSFKTTHSLKTWFVPVAIAALFIVVSLRAYVGFSLQFDWKTQWHWGIILTLALVAGKSLGGVLSDRFGMKKIALITLGIAAALFLLPDYPVAGVIAVFCFNMTMPMTLWALAQIFNQARGFAFGTLTCALFVGFVMDTMLPRNFLPMGVGFSIATMLSAFLLMTGLHGISQKDEIAPENESK